MTTPMDTVETQDWTNRELMLRIYYQTVETNGTVRQHERTLYGDPARGICGIVEGSALNTLYREKLRSVVQVVYILGGTAITAIIALLSLIAVRGL